MISKTPAARKTPHCGTCCSKTPTTPAARKTPQHLLLGKPHNTCCSENPTTPAARKTPQHLLLGKPHNPRPSVIRPARMGLTGLATSTLPSDPNAPPVGFPCQLIQQDPSVEHHWADWEVTSVTVTSGRLTVIKGAEDTCTACMRASRAAVRGTRTCGQVQMLGMQWGSGCTTTPVGPLLRCLPNWDMPSCALQCCLSERRPTGSANCATVSTAVPGTM
jgi:hypothetical protein